MKKRLSAADLQQIDKMGLSREDIENQLRIFENGFPDLQLIKPARLQDGIVSLSERQFIDFQHNYLEGIQAKKVMKFIPSSGAASRMFKFLFDYLENPVYASEQIEYFIKHIKDFAFYEDLKILLKKEGEEVDTLIKKKQYTLIFHYLLSIGGLNYGNLPKALIKFHKYNDFTRTPVEEHIVESADYCINDKNKSALHFTISPEHEDLFNSHVSYIKGFYERAFKAKFEISYSFQKRYTDILAVKPNNEILRDGEGRLVFRPGGHGALLENLNDIEADVVFIKNVDNVVVDKFKQEGNDYKKALAGLMLHYQNKIFYYLNELDKDSEVESEKLDEIHEFVQNQLNIMPPDDLSYDDPQTYRDYLRTKLNRPLRICGMVENKGEPGGGPFWVKDKDGSTSLQIVEKAQINFNDPLQRKAVEESTHFNPVDLVCGLKNYKGKTFDLLEFRDPSAGIITRKSKDGTDLKAQELPGLWNGGMACWNTVFVEVPLATFTPVKTVNDLLREEHQ